MQRFLSTMLVIGMLTACGVTADRFPGTAVPSPVALYGRWQLVLGGQTSVFVLTPSATHHYQVTSPTAPDAATMDASVQVYRGAHYLVVADPGSSAGMSVFRVVDVAPDALRIAALDPKKTEAALRERGLPVVYKKIWLYDEIALNGPALQAVLALPPADIFALNEAMTLTRN